MHHYSILIACDQSYYDDWAMTLLKSIHYHSPWIKTRCHIVNPTNLKKLDFVEYTTETITFSNDTSRISYLQAARIIAASKLPNNECVLTLDADTICTKKFTPFEFSSLFTQQYIGYKPKTSRWLANFITFGPNKFRYRYAELLNSKHIDNWEWGRDQQVMSQLNNEFNFVPAPTYWISIGKNGNKSVFLTLKGDQKTNSKFLEIYKKYIT